MDLSHIRALIEMSVSLFMIMDPIGVVPLFTALTSSMSTTDKLRIARKTSITVVITLLTSAVAGKELLEIFGVNVPSFQVAGGILLMILSLEMLHAFDSPMKRKEEDREEATLRVQRDEPIWVIPLAIPMLTGPATMSTMIIYYSRASSIFDKIWMLATALILGGIVYLVLKWSAVISKRLGRAGINVLTRLMGLLLLAIAVKMIVLGIKELWMPVMK